MAAEIADKFPVQASVILLATWNGGRFRTVKDKGLLLENLKEKIAACKSEISDLSGLQFEEAKFDDDALAGAIKHVYSQLRGIYIIKYLLYVFWDSAQNCRFNKLQH